MGVLACRAPCETHPRVVVRPWPQGPAVQSKAGCGVGPISRCRFERPMALAPPKSSDVSQGYLLAEGGGGVRHIGAVVAPVERGQWVGGWGPTAHHPCRTKTASHEAGLVGGADTTAPA